MLKNNKIIGEFSLYQTIMFKLKPLICKVGLVFAAILGFTACKKKEVPTCDYKASIVFLCQAQGSWQVHLNDSLLRPMSMGQNAIYEIDTGWHQVHITGPQTISEPIYLGQCQTMQFTFP